MIYSKRESDRHAMPGAPCFLFVCLFLCVFVVVVVVCVFVF